VDDQKARQEKSGCGKIIGEVVKSSMVSSLGSCLEAILRLYQPANNGKGAIMKIAVKERETGYQALQQNSGFPIQRLRRLRRNENLRRMVRETSLSIDDFVLPMFVVHGTGVRQEIGALPGNYHLSIDCLVDEAREVKKLDIPAVLLFGLPERKDEAASEALPDGIVQRGPGLKEEVQACWYTDVCMCEYTPHGHCGISTTGIWTMIGHWNSSPWRPSPMPSCSDIMAPAAMVGWQIACHEENSRR
jgi:delta-aminolevulinic acid dehydratase/porphobilinogen synthase